MHGRHHRPNHSRHQRHLLSNLKKIISLEPRDESQLDPERCGTQLTKCHISTIIRPSLNQKITSLRRHPPHSHHHTISTQTSSPLGWNDGSNLMNNPKSNELERLPTRLSADLLIFYSYLSIFSFCSVSSFILVIFTQIGIKPVCAVL